MFCYCYNGIAPPPHHNQTSISLQISCPFRPLEKHLGLSTSIHVQSLKGDTHVRSWSPAEWLTGNITRSNNSPCCCWMYWNPVSPIRVIVCAAGILFLKSMLLCVLINVNLRQRTSHQSTWSTVILKIQEGLLLVDLFFILTFRLEFFSFHICVNTERAFDR